MDPKASTRNVDLVRNVIKDEMFQLYVDLETRDERGEEVDHPLGGLMALRRLAHRLRIKLGDEGKIQREAHEYLKES